MLRSACTLALLALVVTLPAQQPLEETASSFVNFHLNGIDQLRAYHPQYDGSGMVVSVKELLYDTLDIDFAGRHIAHPRSSTELSKHAGLMATILAGAGNTFHTGRGAAPGARLTSSSFAEIFPDPDDYFRQLGISVQNHSYGTDGTENYYSPVAAAYDLQTSRLTELLHVFSIGNAGMDAPDSGPYAGIKGFANMTGAFKTAKNILTVGVVDSFSRIDPLSSRGPTFDGRIRPEVVAFGIGGASAATALTSGVAVLLQQAYYEAHGQMPSAALVKALLINAARDLGMAGPDYTYGFGNVDAYTSMQDLLAGRFLQGTVQVGEAKRWTITVPEGMQRLRITLVWNDPPASVQAEAALVNDLDLEIWHPGEAKLYLPYVLSSFPHPDSLTAAARPGRDRRNNIEHIVVDRPAGGVYEIVVRPHQMGVSEQALAVAYSWDAPADFIWRYPAAGNFVIPDALFTNVLYWESDLPQSKGRLEYRPVNGDWQIIDPEVSLADGALRWYAPDTVTRAQLRMQVDDQAYYSDTFIISSPPRLRLLFDCTDSLGVSWSPHPGIDKYRLYQMGERYMEPYRSTADTFLVLKKRELQHPYLALAPVLEDGQAGVRSFSFRTDRQGGQCYLQSLYGEVIGEEAYLYLETGTVYGVASLELQRWANGQYQARQLLVPTPGNSYTFTDTGLMQGINRYRVRLVLQDGSELLSDPVELEYIRPGAFVIYPNPVDRTGSFRVIYNFPQPETLRFQLYTIHGQLVVELPLYEVENDLFPAALQSGMYVYRIVENGLQKQSGKLIVR